MPGDEQYRTCLYCGHQYPPRGLKHCPECGPEEDATLLGDDDGSDEYLQRRNSMMYYWSVPRSH